MSDTNGKTDVTRREFTELKQELKDHEDECKIRSEKTEQRFDKIENTLTEIKTSMKMSKNIISICVGIGASIVTTVLGALIIYWLIGG